MTVQVEDMDLSLRAFLKGWQFVWCYDVECPNEIPSDYKALEKAASCKSHELRATSHA